MATQRKEYAAPPTGKEKRGKSPSYPPHSDSPRSKKNPNAPPTTPSLPDHHKPVSSSTPPDRRVPNYLKPTVSSRLDPNFTIDATKQASNHSQNPTLNRRRSFDKPQSLTPSHRTHTSTFGYSTERDLKSSKGLTKAKSLPKTHLEKLSLPKAHQERPLKSIKEAGKSHLSYGRVPNSATTVKKSTNIGLNKKQNDNAATSSSAVAMSTKAIASPDIADSTREIEPHQEDQELLITDVEEDKAVKVEIDNELPAEISTPEDKEPKNKNNQPEDLNLKPSEPLTVLEDQNEAIDVHIEEPEEKLVVETREEQSKDESNESQTEFEVEGEEEKRREESEIENEGNQTVGKEGEVGDVGTETKEEVNNVAASSSARQGGQGGQGKKDSQSQAYNDVIEETASKLLEKRKNKVKALVGAFETVISLQEPEA